MLDMVEKEEEERLKETYSFLPLSPPMHLWT